MTLPYVVLSAAMSLDGYIDDASDTRLLLSNPADFDRVDEVRSSCDAILIGGETLRRDNPRLLVNSSERRSARRSRGLPEYPLKITLTRRGGLSRDLKFWHHGDQKLVYCPHSISRRVADELRGLTTVVGLAPAVTPRAIVEDLGERGVMRLMVEGGGTIHTQFLTAGVVDELHLAVAPFFVGDHQAPRFVNSGNYPFSPANRMELVEARPIGDIALLVYRPSPAGAERGGDGEIAMSA